MLLCFGMIVTAAYLAMKKASGEKSSRTSGLPQFLLVCHFSSSSMHFSSHDYHLMLLPWSLSFTVLTLSITGAAIKCTRLGKKIKLVTCSKLGNHARSAASVLMRLLYLASLNFLSRSQSGRISQRVIENILLLLIC